MKFEQAYEALKQGAKIKMPNWTGYWVWEDNTIKMYCKNGEVIDIRDTKDVDYTLNFILSDEWEIVPNDNICPTDLNIRTFSFGEALRFLKQGKRLTRKGWNGKDLFVVYQKGYPQGIPCNKQTAMAWGIKEGELFKCEPYLQINTVDGSHAMWVPSIRDCFAWDWYIVK